MFEVLREMGADEAGGGGAAAAAVEEDKGIE